MINPSLAQSSDFHWPAELRGVRPCNLEQSTSLATSPRTVAEHLQAPAEDSALPACVNHRPASLWLNSEFGAAYKYLNSTQLNPDITTQATTLSYFSVQPTSPERFDTICLNLQATQPQSSGNKSDHEREWLWYIMAQATFRSL